GTTLNPAGSVSGTVTAAGATPPTFRATDACDAAVEKELPIVVAGALDLTKGKASERFIFGTGGVAQASRYLELTAGTKLSITLSGASTKTEFAQVLLTDSAGNAIDLSARSKATKKATSVKGYVVP